jgi:hypothetical protein
MSRGPGAGTSLIAGGVATLACYAVLLWTAVFWNEDSRFPGQVSCSSSSVWAWCSPASRS